METQMNESNQLANFPHLMESSESTMKQIMKGTESSKKGLKGIGGQETIDSKDKLFTLGNQAPEESKEDPLTLLLQAMQGDSDYLKKIVKKTDKPDSEGSLITTDLLSSSEMNTPINSKIISQLQTQLQSRIQSKENTLKTLQQHLSRQSSLEKDPPRSGNLTRISEEVQGQSNSQVTVSGKSPNQTLSKISKVNDNSLSQFFNKEELQLINMNFDHSGETESTPLRTQKDKVQPLSLQNLEPNLDLKYELNPKHTARIQKSTEFQQFQKRELLTSRNEKSAKSKKLNQSLSSAKSKLSQSPSTIYDRLKRRNSNNQEKAPKKGISIEGTSSNQTEYMRIFETLLDSALKQQNYTSKNVDRDLLSKCIITRVNTKSFRDLCSKLLAQNNQLNTYANEAKLRPRSLEKSFEQKCQQLSTQNAQLQKQVQEQQESLKKFEVKEEKQCQLIYTLKKKVANHQEQIEELSSVNKDMGVHCEKLNSMIQSLQAERQSRSEEQTPAFSPKSKKLDVSSSNNSKEVLMVDLDPSLSSKFNLEPYISSCRQAKQTLEHYYSIIKLLNMENEKLKSEFKVISDAKSSSESQSEQKLESLQSHLTKIKDMFNSKLLEQKKMIDDISLQSSRSKNELSAQEMENSRLKKELHEKHVTEEQNQASIEKLKSDLADSLQKLSVVSGVNVGFQKDMNSLKNEYDHLKSQAEVYKDQIKSFKEDVSHLKGFDFQLWMRSDGGRAPGKKVRMNRNNEFEFVTTMEDQLYSFSSRFEGVSSFSQAVAQAKQIEKFLKMDKIQKGVISELKKTLDDFCGDFSRFDRKIKEVVHDKEQLEKILLEILGFSDCCDERYNQLMAKIDEYSKSDKQQFEKISSEYSLLKAQLAEQVKNIFVDIEDNVIRDELLSILTDIDKHSVNDTVGMLIEKLVHRIRDLLLKNKRLFTVNADQLRTINDNESNIAKITKGLYDEMDRLDMAIREIDIATQRLIIKVSDGQSKSGDSTINPLVQVNVSERSKLNTEAVLNSINLALSLVSEWISEQVDEIPLKMKNQRLVLQLQHEKLQSNRQHFTEKESTVSRGNSCHSLQGMESKEKKILQDILSRVTDLRNQTEDTQADQPIDFQATQGRGRSSARSSNKGLKSKSGSLHRPASKSKDKYDLPLSKRSERIEFLIQPEMKGVLDKNSQQTCLDKKFAATQESLREHKESQAQYVSIRQPASHPLYNKVAQGKVKIPSPNQLENVLITSHNNQKYKKNNQFERSRRSSARMSSNRSSKSHSDIKGNRERNGGITERANGTSSWGPINYQPKGAIHRSYTSMAQFPIKRPKMRSDHSSNSCISKSHHSRYNSSTPGSKLPLRIKGGNRSSNSDAEFYGATQQKSERRQEDRIQPSRALRIKNQPLQIKPSKPQFSECSYKSRRTHSLGTNNSRQQSQGEYFDARKLPSNQSRSSRSSFKRPNSINPSNEMHSHIRYQSVGHQSSQHARISSGHFTLEKPEESKHNTSYQIIQTDRNGAYKTIGEGIVPYHSRLRQKRDNSFSHRTIDNRPTNVNDSMITMPLHDQQTLATNRPRGPSHRSSKSTIKRYGNDKGEFRSKAAKKIMEQQRLPAPKSKQEKDCNAIYHRHKNSRHILNEKLQNQYDSISQEMRSRSQSPNPIQPRNSALKQSNAAITPSKDHLKRLAKNKNHLKTISEQYPEKIRQISELLENQHKLLRIARSKHNQTGMEEQRTPQNNHLMSQNQLGEIKRSYSQISKDFKKSGSNHQKPRPKAQQPVKQPRKSKVSTKRQGKRLSSSKQGNNSQYTSAITTEQSCKQQPKPIINIKTHNQAKEMSHHNQTGEEFPTFHQNSMQKGSMTNEFENPIQPFNIGSGLINNDHFEDKYYPQQVDRRQNVGSGETVSEQPLVYEFRPLTQRNSHQSSQLPSISEEILSNSLYHVTNNPNTPIPEAIPQQHDGSSTFLQSFVRAESGQSYPEPGYRYHNYDLPYLLESVKIQRNPASESDDASRYTEPKFRDDHL